MGNGKLIKFKSKGAKTSSDGDILDHGKFGAMSYEVYKRGVIHIFKKNSKLMFKKDCSIFEDEISEIDFDILSDGEEFVLEGSGDNDHLIFKKENGDISITLRKRGFKMIDKILETLNKGKQNKRTKNM